jgi:hypothetical protein
MENSSNTQSGCRNNNAKKNRLDYPTYVRYLLRHHIGSLYLPIKIKIMTSTGKKHRVDHPTYVPSLLRNDIVYHRQCVPLYTI